MNDTTTRTANAIALAGGVGVLLGLAFTMRNAWIAAALIASACVLIRFVEHEQKAAEAAHAIEVGKAFEAGVGVGERGRYG